MSQFFPIVIFYFIFGIGAGIRYIYYFLIGKKKKYDDLIAPTSQSVWNILLSLVVIGLFIVGSSKLDKQLKEQGRHRSLEKLIK